jgi:hypothetical protein
MKRILAFAAVLALATASLLADDLARLEGKWTTKKTRPDGQTYTQVIEIKKDKFTFRLLRAGDELALFAEGNVKTETAGGFSILRLTDIKGGASESDTQAINDDRAGIYVLSEDTLTLVTNMDKERERQKPSLDVYTKAKK